MIAQPPRASTAWPRTPSATMPAVTETEVPEVSAPTPTLSQMPNAPEPSPTVGHPVMNLLSLNLQVRGCTYMNPEMRYVEECEALVMYIKTKNICDVIHGFPVMKSSIIGVGKGVEKLCE